MLRTLILLLLAVVTAVLTWVWTSSVGRPRQPIGPVVRYVALGDSYTVGQGVKPADAWPAQLTAALRRRGHAVELVATLAVTGWTTQDVLDTALPIAAAAHPQLVTLLIGANDVAQGVSTSVFREHLAQILDQVTADEGGRVLVLTIPDFTATPAAARFDPAAGARITEFNGVLRETAADRGLAVVDLTQVSRTLSGQPGMLVADGLHPSAAQYARWVPPILERVLDVLPQ